MSPIRLEYCSNLVGGTQVFHGVNILDLSIEVCQGGDILLEEETMATIMWSSSLVLDLPKF